MNTESPRLRALLAAGAALVVFGITIPATASPDGSGRPADGSVGMANEKARPKGQSIDNPNGDKNNGFRCDSNGGAGAGNPALGSCPTPTPTPTPTPPPSGSGSSETPPPVGEGDTPPPPADGGGDWWVDN